MEFFLNYGGPGGYWWHEGSDGIKALEDACKKFYPPPKRKVSFTVKGIEITVDTYSLHRGIHLSIPDDASDEAVFAFERAKDAAKLYSTAEYAITKHNCVTGVAVVLNAIIPRMVSSDLVLPWTLDTQLNRYLDKHKATTTFIEAFRAKNVEIDEDHDLEEIESVNDILNLFIETVGVGQERTRSTLIEIGWITEGKDGMLIPTKEAPKDFKEGLLAYNEDYYKAKELERIYKSEAEVVSDDINRFFESNPPFNRVRQMLEDNVSRNMDGDASKRTLEKFKELKSYKSSGFKEKLHWGRPPDASGKKLGW